jgi:hypothetical protein
VLIEASKQEKVHSFSKSARRVWSSRDHDLRRGQLALIMRAREMIAPYIHGKKPVVVSHDFSGLKDLVIEGVTHSREEVQDIVDADFIAIEDQSDEEEAGE